MQFLASTVGKKHVPSILNAQPPCCRQSKNIFTQTCATKCEEHAKIIQKTSGQTQGRHLGQEVGADGDESNDGQREEEACNGDPGDAVHNEKVDQLTQREGRHCPKGHRLHIRRMALLQQPVHTDSSLCYVFRNCSQSVHFSPCPSIWHESRSQKS
jgi:hypothetical protein